MPYEVKKRGDQFCVVKQDGGKSMGCHPSRQKANAQMAALYAHEKGRYASFTVCDEATGEWIVKPVVALVDGVIHASNVKHAERVSAAVMTACLDQWEGKPIFAGHPKADGMVVLAEMVDFRGQIGHVANPRVEGDKFLLEAWFERKLLTASQIQHLELDIPIDVSVGVLAAGNKKPGEFFGKRYASEWTDVEPDHLAVLFSGERGACSWEMGCGLRAASHGKELRFGLIEGGTDQMKPMYAEWLEAGPETDELLKTLRNYSTEERDKMPAEDFAGKNRSFPIKVPADVFDAAKSIGRAGSGNYSPDELKSRIVAIAYRKGASFVAQLPDAWKKKKDQKNASLFERALAFFGRGAGNLDALQADLSDSDLRRKLQEALQEAGESAGIVDVYPDKGYFAYCSYSPGSNAMDYYRRTFTEANGTVTLGNVRTEVEPRTVYEPVAAEDHQCSCKQESTMTEQEVKALQAKLDAAEGENKTLKAAAEARAQADQKAAEEKAAADKTAADLKAAEAAKTAPAAAAPVAKTAEELMDPAERESFKAFKAAEAARKDKTIKTLKDSGRCSFSDADLQAKSQAELDNLVKLADIKAAVDFSGNGVPKDNTAPKAAPEVPSLRAALAKK